MKNITRRTNSKLKQAFEQTADTNLWNDPDSLSGRGSNMVQTHVIREKIPEILLKYDIKSIIDAPCGDIFWMRTLFPFLKENGISYLGGDIVESIISKNRKHEAEGIKFMQIDLSHTVPPYCDLILTRDCFIHLSYRNIISILSNYKKAKIKFLLVSTNTYDTRINTDVDGFFIQGRMVNLQRFPFYFKRPIELINEGCTEDDGIYADKSLGLWKLSELSLYKAKFNIHLLYIVNLPNRMAEKVRNFYHRMKIFSKF